MRNSRAFLVRFFAETTITVEELQNLEVGDVLMTEKPASSPTVVFVEAIPKFLGSVGQHRGNRAVKIRRAVLPTDRI